MVGDGTKEGPEVALALNREEQNVAGHLVVTLELDLGYRQVQIQTEALQVGANLGHRVITRAECRYVGEDGAHSHRALAILHSQLGNDQGLDRR